MALELNIAQSELGIPFPNAYVRVGNVTLDKEKARVMLVTYANADARQADARPISQAILTFNTPGLTGDILPAVYGAIKALPEFAGALDV